MIRLGSPVSSSELAISTGYQVSLFQLQVV